MVFVVDPGMILSAAADCSSIFSESSVLSMPTTLGDEFVMIVTRYIAELMDESPGGQHAQGERVGHAQAHSPSVLMVSLWVMSLDDVDRAEDGGHVVVETPAPVTEFLTRVTPAHHEGRETVLDRVLGHAAPRREVEHVMRNRAAPSAVGPAADPPGVDGAYWISSTCPSR